MTELPVLGLGDMPVLGFEGRNDACTEDAKPLTIRWRDGTFCGILAPLDPEWLKTFEAQQLRNQELRDNGVAVLDDYK